MVCTDPLRRPQRHAAPADLHRMHRAGHRHPARRIVFRPDDFKARWDRAIRSMRRCGRFASTCSAWPVRKAGEPYPLLVVRPGGVVAYGAARAALKAWDDEFGYELISRRQAARLRRARSGAGDSAGNRSVAVGPPAAGGAGRHDAAHASTAMSRSLRSIRRMSPRRWQSRRGRRRRPGERHGSAADAGGNRNRR